VSFYGGGWIRVYYSDLLWVPAIADLQFTVLCIARGGHVYKFRVESDGVNERLVWGVSLRACMKEAKAPKVVRITR
jgi:hypothetical protein